MNQIDLAGKRAVVTGGARGIGYAIAGRLLASGALVSLWDRDGDRLAQAQAALSGAVTVDTRILDVTDGEAVQAAADGTAAALGGLDILVTSAGITGPSVPSWELSLTDWRSVIDIDLNGVFYCCRAVLPRMMADGYGRIVNIASIAGKEGNPNASSYSASKAGVIALTKSLAKETAVHDIAVNCITPAVVKTEMLDQMTDAHVQYMLSKIPRGRFLTVEEVAAMVAWLVSSENSFTTGAAFDLSGGRATY